MTKWPLLVVMALAAGLAPSLSVSQPAATMDWRPFEGSWTLAGHRHALPTGGARDATVVELSGAVALDLAQGLPRGFRGEVIGFDNGAERSIGRFVWTDDRGDQIFGDVSGEPLQSTRRFVGTITGGTGRYRGVSGGYELTWQYVVLSEGGLLQGRAIGLKGRYRIEAPPS